MSILFCYLSFRTTTLDLVYIDSVRVYIAASLPKSTEPLKQTFQRQVRLERTHSMTDVLGKIMLFTRRLL